MPESLLVRTAQCSAPAASRALVLALVALIHALDLATGPQVSMQAVHLVPLAIAAWCLPRVEGLGAALIVTLGMAAAAAVEQPATAGADSAVAAWQVLSAAVVSFAFALLIGAQRDAVLAAARQATHDPLTGLLREDRFARALERERSRAARGDRPLTVVVFDLDGLDQVVAEHGGAEGDRVLETVGATLQQVLRDADLAGRTGRDSFALAASECDAREAQSLLARLRAALLAAMWSRAWPVTFRFGAATTATPAVTSGASLYDSAMAACSSAPLRSPASRADSRPPSRRDRRRAPSLASTR